MANTFKSMTAMGTPYINERSGFVRGFLKARTAVPHFAPFKRCKAEDVHMGKLGKSCLPVSFLQTESSILRLGITWSKSPSNTPKLNGGGLAESCQ